MRMRVTQLLESDRFESFGKQKVRLDESRNLPGVFTERGTHVRTRSVRFEGNGCDLTITMSRVPNAPHVPEGWDSYPVGSEHEISIDALVKA